MANRWAGVTAGLLAGAAGATAQNIVSYLDQAASGDAPVSSPTSPDVAETAAQVTGHKADPTRARAAGPLGGIAIGLGVGAVAGVVRGSNATPPPAVAAVVTGLVAMGLGDGLAAATSGSKPVWSSPTNLVRDLISHLAYGAVTGYTLHRMLDPHTPVVSRIRSLAR